MNKYLILAFALIFMVGCKMQSTVTTEKTSNYETSTPTEETMKVQYAFAIVNTDVYMVKDSTLYNAGNVAFNVTNTSDLSNVDALMLVTKYLVEEEIGTSYVKYHYLDKNYIVWFENELNYRVTNSLD